MLLRSIFSYYALVPLFLEHFIPKTSRIYLAQLDKTVPPIEGDPCSAMVHPIMYLVIEQNSIKWTNGSMVQ